MEKKRTLLNDMAKKHIIQWKISLPEDLWDHIFLNYCDYDSIVTTRMLQSAYVKDCTKGNNFYLAIYANNLNNVKWFYQCEGVTFNNLHLCHAVSDGTLSIMKWLRRMGCPWNSNTFLCAAKRGDLKKMEWLKENECPCDSRAFKYAAEAGNLEVLDWLRLNNSPWDENAFRLNLENSSKEWLLIHSMITN